jgi:rod shape-determining protein MreC
MPSLNRQTKLVIITVVVILLLFFLHYTRILSPVERALVGMTKPLLKITYSISNSVGEKYLEYQSKNELVRENKELKDELIILLKEKAHYFTEKEENEFLRTQLGFVKANNFEYEIANVVGKNPDNTQNSLLVDKGEKHGLIVGQPVLADEGMLIGKLVRVDRATSTILLINDDLSKVAAKIQTQYKTIGVVEGEFGLGMKMKLVPQSEVISESDIVVTSGLEDLVPANLIIGQVERIYNQPEELFQEVSIRTFVDLGKITIVNIIKKVDDI